MPTQTARVTTEQKRAALRARGWRRETIGPARLECWSHPDHVRAYLGTGRRLSLASAWKHRDDTITADGRWLAADPAEHEPAIDEMSPDGPSEVQSTVSPPWTISPVEPTDDPDWYRTIELCGSDCHHPVHAFGSPQRLRHLVDAPLAKLAIKNGWIE